MRNSKPLKNAAWIIGCRIVQAGLNFLITMLTARYLGPSDFGLINYAASVVAFVIPIMHLGMDSIMIQELVMNKNTQGEVLGTAITMSFLSALLCIVGVSAFIGIANPGEMDTLLVCTLYSLNLPLQALEIIQYWYQANLKAKYTSLTSLGAYILVSFYKIFLLSRGKSVYWFAVSYALDYLIIAAVLFFLYPRLGGQRMSFSLGKGWKMFSKGKYYVISAMMITVFAQTDKIMLKIMLGEVSVGYYAAAISCAGATSFVFSAIIGTARPIILEAKEGLPFGYKKRLVLLYSIIIYLSLAQNIVVAIFADLMIDILYGVQYQLAVPVLRILVWYTTFSYLGSARGVWILAEEKYHLTWRVNLCGAGANVILNSFLIPKYGAEGAAVASLITQAFTNVGMGIIIKELRENNNLILMALNPKHLLTAVRRLICS